MLRPLLMRKELEVLLMLAKDLPSADLPRLLGEIREIEATAVARLSTPAVSQPDELLTVEQAAARLNLSKDYLYRHSRRLPFARRIGRKLLFSSNGLDSYLKKANR